MKRKAASILLPFLFVCNASILHAQDDADTHISFDMNVRSVWIEVLLLPTARFSAFGLGLDVDILKVYPLDSAKIQHSFGLRSWIGSGATNIVRSCHNSPFCGFYSDLDLLLRWTMALSSKDLSVAMLTGYSYRKMQYGPNGARLKFGVEVNAMIIRPFLALRFRAMSSAFAPDGLVEPGPLALGISVGWFNSE